MNQSQGGLCRWYRPLGALLLLLAVLLLLLRSCGPQKPTAVVETPEAPVLPAATAAPTAVLPTAVPTAAPTELPTRLPTAAATELPTLLPPALPTALPTAPPVAVPSLNQPTGADLTAEGLKLSGTGEPGATVELWDGSTKLGTVVVGADGLWSLVVRLSEGEHKLAVRTVDAAGNPINESPPLDVAVAAAEAPTTTAPDLMASGEAYIVQPGDWLLKLARRFYGVSGLYTLIIEGTNAKAEVDSSFGRIVNPNLILVGQKLWIPALPGGK